MAQLDALLKSLGRGGIDRPAFQPTARPVDTVAVNTRVVPLPEPVKPVRPQAPADPLMPTPPAKSNVDQLVSALASLNPTLNRFMGTYFEEQNKQDRLDAEMAFMLHNSPTSWGEAVRKDPTLVDRSPVFRQVYESRIARTAVQKRAGELIAEYHNSPIAASEDPSAIVGWLQERMKDLLDATASPAAKEALIEEIQTVSHRFMQAHAEVARKNLWEKNQQSYGTRLQTTFDNYQAMGPAVPFQTDDPVAKDAIIAEDPQYGRIKVAFLNGVTGGEAAGKYNIRYDGGAGSLFELNGQHPRVKVRITKGPNAGLTSDAAGRYQFLSSTWDELMGPNTPFTPENQDRAAIKLAERDYRARTGRNLWEDLSKEGLSPRIQAIMAPTWEAFKGNRGRHLATYNASLQRYGQTPTGPGVQNAHIPEIVEEVKKIEQEGFKQGMTFAQINEETLKAVTTNAIIHKDESILEVASLVRPHGLSAAEKKQIEDARLRIRNLKLEEQNQKASAEKAAIEAREAAVTSTVAQHLLTQMQPGPNGEPPKAPVVPKELLEAAAAEDAVNAKKGTPSNLFENLVKLQKNLDDVNKVEDQSVVATITAKAYSGYLTPQDIINEVSNGRLKNHVTIQQLLEFTSRRTTDSPLNDPGVPEIIKNINNIIGGSQGPFGGFKDPERAANAISMFTLGLMKWKKENPTADPIQVLEQAEKLQEQVFRIYAPNSSFFKTRPEVMQKQAAAKTGSTSAATAPEQSDATAIQPRAVEWRKAPVYQDEALLDREWAEFENGNYNTTLALWLKANGLLGNSKGAFEFYQAQKELLRKQSKR